MDDFQRSMRSYGDKSPRTSRELLGLPSKSPTMPPTAGRMGRMFPNLNTDYPFENRWHHSFFARVHPPPRHSTRGGFAFIYKTTPRLALGPARRSTFHPRRARMQDRFAERHLKAKKCKLKPRLTALVFQRSLPRTVLGGASYSDLCADKQTPLQSFECAIFYWPTSSIHNCRQSVGGREVRSQTVFLIFLAVHMT